MKITSARAVFHGTEIETEEFGLLFEGTKRDLLNRGVVFFQQSRGKFAAAVERDGSEDVINGGSADPVAVAVARRSFDMRNGNPWKHGEIPIPSREEALSEINAGGEWPKPTAKEA